MATRDREACRKFSLKRPSSARAAVAVSGSFRSIMRQQNTSPKRFSPYYYQTTSFHERNPRFSKKASASLLRGAIVQRQRKVCPNHLPITRCFWRIPATSRWQERKTPWRSTSQKMTMCFGGIKSSAKKLYNTQNHSEIVNACTSVIGASLSFLKMVSSFPAQFKSKTSM